ncbi:MAG: radical SAM protein [archaeon]|nr:radical SAM protein [archaeon]
MYHEILAKSALNHIVERFPYRWDLNIYRGCMHHCQYCFAMYSHKFLLPSKSNKEGYFQEIFVKTNIARLLEKELSSKKWKKELINIGGVTDSYQPAESKYKLMRQVLKVMIKYKNPIIISTKNALILRDFDLINELSEQVHVNIAATITTMDEDIRKLIEPNSSPSLERFKVLKEFRKTKASIGLHVMPILPFITDDTENLDKIFSLGKECGVDYFIPSVLYLRGDTKPHFMKFIKNNFPDLYGKYLKLYGKNGNNSNIKEQIYKKVEILSRKYQLSRENNEILKIKTAKKNRTLDYYF